MSRKMKTTEATKDAAAAIARCETHEELNAVYAAAKDRWGQIDREALQEFSVGDEVWFETSKGRRVEATVKKVNRKTCNVEEIDGFWRGRVSPSFLNHL